MFILFNFFQTLYNYFANGKFVEYLSDNIVVVVVFILVALLVIHFVKKIIGLAVSIGFIVIIALYLGVLRPASITDYSSIINDNLSAYEAVANASEYVKISEGNILVKVDDNWFNINSLQEIASNGDSVKYKGQSYKIDNKDVQKVLKMLESSR